MPIVFAQPEGVSPGYTPGNDSFTKWLVHSDTTNGSTTAVDSSTGGTDSPRSTTMANGAQHSTTRQYFGATSMRMFGGTDNVYAVDSTDWDIGSGDFAIDTWVNFNTLNAGANSIVSYFNGGAPADKGFAFTYNEANNRLQFLYTIDGSTNKIRHSGTSSWSPTLNTWYHVAVTRNGADLRFFLDGTQLGSTTSMDADSVYNAGEFMRIGAIRVDNAIYTPETLDGYIDEFRFSVGDSRWTSNFTPPTLPYGP